MYELFEGFVYLKFCYLLSLDIYITNVELLKISYINKSEGLEGLNIIWRDIQGYQVGKLNTRYLNQYFCLIILLNVKIFNFPG
jgi:hypothetical protein